MTRYAAFLLVLLVSVGGSSCARSANSQTPPNWTSGFWYWHPNGAEAAPAEVTPDVLYAHAGRFWGHGSGTAPEQWSMSGELPDSLPGAREYYLVFREETPGVPDVAAVPALIRQVVRLGETAKPRHLRVVGVQLDIDSPTAQLRKYAGFLREVRKAMPAGLEISITGLLDWFRAGTSVTDVVEQVDEFVPQFYDIGPRGTPDDRSAVAATIDAGEWAPKFNRFGKRFRIGISTFGRARLLPSEGPAQAGNASVGMARIFGDLTPLDVAGNPGFGLQTSRNEAKELVLDYRAVREVRIGYSAFKPGDRIQFILPTPDEIRAAADSARRMGAHCAGVVFFRWPASNENLVMPPDEVLMAAGLVPARPRAVRLELVNGHCAAVSCVDVHLVNARGLSSETTRYRVHSSVDLEYFLPEERVPVRMAGAADLEVTFPPYAGPNDLLLGRAVTGTRAEFRVEQEP